MWEDVDLLLRAVVRVIPGSVERVTDRFQPKDFILEGNFPNPFNHSTVLSFVLTTPASASLTIIDSRGTYVRSLARGFFGRGRHRMAWDGCDERGNRVSTGVYFAVLSGEGLLLKQKMLLLQ